MLAGALLVSGSWMPATAVLAVDPGAWMPRAVYRLVPSGTWYGRWSETGIVSAGQAAEAAQGTYLAVYAAEMEPGQNYDLGLRLQADLNTRVRVAIFDRSPWAPGARRYDLPMGPVIRTASPEVEYRWHVGVSPHSEGRTMFITIEAVPGTPGQWCGVWYAIYLARAPRSPMNTLGRGITYLEGPRDLVLPGRREGSSSYMMAAPDPLAAGSGPSGPGWSPSLIGNGDFRRGLQGWTLIPEDDPAVTGRVVVDENGLIIRGDGGASQVGVRQVLQRRVMPGRPLMLRVVVRLDRFAPAADAGNTAPLVISLCYLDGKDEEHCGERAYRRRFFADAAAADGMDVVRIPYGVWFEFEDDLGRTTPGPVVITSASITGGGIAGVTARIRDIRLLQTAPFSGK